MTNYEYLIIGGGMVAAATMDGIRQVDSTGRVGLISAGLDAPYDRPPTYRKIASEMCCCGKCGSRWRLPAN